MRALISIASLACSLCLTACAERPADQAAVIYAASSLTDVLTELERAYEASTPGPGVDISFAGSQVLRLQIEQGAPADVFASANLEHMEALQRGGLVTNSRVFLRNELVVIVPRDNPAGIERFADLPKARRLVVGAPEVPIGAYTARLLAGADAQLGQTFSSAVRQRVVSEESNVRLVRAKVELGEADAAIVYRSDAAASDRVQTITIPAPMTVHADYAIGALASSSRGRAVQRWLSFVVGDAAREVFTRHGFALP
jgi:molybdate transport system substrate-binding protein